MVDVMVELQRRRTASRVFAGKHGYITPRDLFRWADRTPGSYQELAEAGYMLLGERLRQPAEQAVVREVLQKLLPRVKVEPSELYSRLHSEHRAAAAANAANAGASGRPDGATAVLTRGGEEGAVWIPSAVRIYSLVAACMAHDEPVLLVGETGTGKTTVCQLYAEAAGQKLHIINCHQHTETADFLGGLRPARGRAFQVEALAKRVASFEAQAAAIAASGAAPMDVEATTGAPAPDLSLDAVDAAAAAAADGGTDAAVAALEARIEAAAAKAAEASGEASGEASATSASATSAADAMSLEAASLREAAAACKALFVWEDGPLLTAMRNGDLLLVDEISLADDAVLERLNSVLDPNRTIVLPEKGRELEEVVAAPGFRLLATMNPGGDFGKKELSPALRNRFTEIWVPAVGSRDELLQLLRTKLHAPPTSSALAKDGASKGGLADGEQDEEWDAADAMLAFVEWLATPETAATSSSAAGEGGGGGGLGVSTTPSLRDLTAWIDFQNATRASLGPYAAFVHGASLVFIDAIGLSTASSRALREARRARCIQRLLGLLPPSVAAGGVASLHVGSGTVPEMADGDRPRPYDASASPASASASGGGRLFGLPPFFVDLGLTPSDAAFSLHAPTTRANAFRVLRAMQLRKPVLLEGSPGVGKTSLIQALGAACGHTVVRINLSEQSDLMELLGTDLPVEGAPAGTYAWQDGAFLAALKAGHWVILDELNLAPQSVLEGLNSCLDHRASVFIPELGASFACPSGFRVFGCQNPLQQGGGRKGLPKSFLNRFTQVRSVRHP